MLALVALSLAILYLALDRTGIIDELVDAVRKRGGTPARWRPKDEGEPASDREVDRRLEVFQNFIERLQPPDEDEE